MINSIADLEARFGESAVAAFIKSFSCPLNSEVEDFLKKRPSSPHGFRHRKHISSSMMTHTSCWVITHS